MKVGTDGVLLGAWANPQLSTLHSQPSTLNPQLSALHCLDIGTGTGVIALMLAQRFPSALIEGIDIDEASVLQARENVEASPFATRVNIKNADFSRFDCFSKRYDLIVSNPPFYKEDTLGGDKARDAARHTQSLPFVALVANTSRLLTERGHFAVIIPHSDAADFISLCALHHLYLTRRTDVRSNERKPFKRSMLEFGKTIQPATTDTLTLHDTENRRTPEYTKLTKDFYL